MTTHPRRVGAAVWLVTVLAALAGLFVPAVSAAASVGPETRVRASDHLEAVLVGRVDLGSSTGVEVSDPDLRRLVSATGVATNPAAADNMLPEFTPKQYIRPGGGSRPGTGTVGMLELGDGTGAILQSGRSGPAASIPRGTPGFNGITKTHVEGHAAALMRQTGAQEATLWINRIPCAGVNGCAARLPGMLPEGARLRVLGPDGYDEVFTGLPD